MRLHRCLAGWVIAACLLASPLIAEDPGKGVNFYSTEKEIALGKQVARETERQATIVEDPQVAEYVNRLYGRISRAVPTRSCHSR